jgi:single-stranded-DNA-specific exonuclease
VFENKSLLDNLWKLENCDEREILNLSQKNNLSPLLSKLLYIRNIDSNNIDEFLDPDLINNIPDPFTLIDMDKAITRVIHGISKNEIFGIVADYDVDGSTSASILYKFLSIFSNKIILKIPNRLSEGYGPNMRIMDEMMQCKASIVFTLDCGTTSNHIIDNEKFKNIDVIVIDHHLSDTSMPKVHSIINPNRIDESKNFFSSLAAVGVTFLFLMGLRKKLREKNFFKEKITEPNLLSFLDLVSLGTVCDVVSLKKYNRMFVKIGLELIKQRKNKGISKIIDNSNLKSTPSSSDLGFIIGPQLNAASRIDDSTLPSKILTSNNIVEIESISRKLILLNEKRKLIESSIFEEALIQAELQKHKKYILVYGHEWHNGVLGIIASRLIEKFYKPSIVISFTNSIGIGSARSIKNIDLGNIIIAAKNQNLLLGGGGHKMAAGLQIHYKLIEKFDIFISQHLSPIPDEIFQRIESFDTIISVNELNNNLLEIIDKLEPFGMDNPEPKFLINDIQFNQIKILKDKHLLFFFQNDFSQKLKAICFNCIGTKLGDYLLNYKNNKLSIFCTIKKDNFSQNVAPQIIIKDAMLIN